MPMLIVGPTMQAHPNDLTDQERMEVEMKLAELRSYPRIEEFFLSVAFAREDRSDELAAASSVEFLSMQIVKLLSECPDVSSIVASVLSAVRQSIPGKIPSTPKQSTH